MVEVFTSQSDRDGLWRFKILDEKGDVVALSTVRGYKTEREAVSVAKNITNNKDLMKIAKAQTVKIEKLTNALIFAGALAGGFAAAWAVCWLS